MDELLLLTAGQSPRLQSVLHYALDRLPWRSALPGESLRGRKLVFAAALDRFGPGEDFCRLLRTLRASEDGLDGASAALLIDGAGEGGTKAAARALVLAANGAGCAFPGKPLVEGTGSLHNLDVLSRNMGLSQAETYRETARALLRRLSGFSPPKPERPRVLMLHASDHATSNTLALGGALRGRLEPDIAFEELSLRNGAVFDCRGCSYTVCSHYAKSQSCFYGGSIVDEVYPALMRAGALLLLLPNYNDSVSANIMAFINRLTSLQLFHSLHDKYLYAIVVSGYSGSDLVAQQVLGALCLNKAFLLPPRFCLLETANDPGSALRAPGIGARLARFAASIRAAAGPADG